MQKLTPFQKKVARWYLAHPKIRKAALEYGAELSMLVDLIVPGAIIFWFKMSWGAINSTIIALVMSGVATFAFMISVVLTGYAYRKYVLMANPDVLPECAIGDARKIIENYPKFAGLLENRINVAIAEDDGTELVLYLGEIKTWGNMKDEFVVIQKNEKEIATEIAALEKELGL